MFEEDNCDVIKVNCTLSLNYGVNSPLKFKIKQCPHDHKQITPIVTNLYFPSNLNLQRKFFLFLKYGPIYKNVMYNSIYTHNKYKKIIQIKFFYKYKIYGIEALN